jgi:hypothetical protein
MVPVRFLIQSLLMLSALIIPVLSFAVTPDCSYSTQVITDEYNFDVSTRPLDSCEKQSFKIAVKTNANPFALYESETGTILERAWAEDLDDDGHYELFVVSRKASEPSRKSLEMFYLEGNALKRIHLPEPGGMSGYRGGDRFVTGWGRIIRTFPRYLEKDLDGEPTGGEQQFVYQYRNRELLLAAEPEFSINEHSGAKPAAKSRNTSAFKVQSIEVRKEYIEIKADAPIENYKIIRISEPWRLIIDIPGAVSAISERTVQIGSHNVSRARIGAHKGFLRIVLDSTVSPLPTETVTPLENSLRVSFFKLPGK